MRVPCAVDEITLTGDYDDADGDPVNVRGVCVTCSRCDQTAEVYGTSARSVRRGLVMLREECPRGENNFYVADEAEGD
jgi:CII-binding regulator of phage lambda lysogenization HflD